MSISPIFDFMDRRHAVSQSEVDDILMSGPPQSFAEYAMTPAPAVDSGWSALRRLHDRPGSTEPGTMPVHVPDGGAGLASFERSITRPIHWLLMAPLRTHYFAACDPERRSQWTSAGLRSAGFREAVGGARACPICSDLFNDHLK